MSFLLSSGIHHVLYIGSASFEEANVAGFPHLLESPGFFSLKFQDLESHFAPGKSWKLKCKILENILENYASLKSPAFLALNLVS